MENKSEFLCGICQNPKNTIEDLESHVKTHDINESLFAKSLFECFLCGKIFNDELILKNHKKSHLNGNFNIYKCELCTRTFSKG